MKKIGLLLMLLCVLFGSCHESEEPAPLPPMMEPQADWVLPDPPLSDRMLEIPHYVSGYVWPTKFVVSCLTDRIRDGFFQLFVDNGYYYAGYDSSSESAREAYETLCQRNGDVGYERKERLSFLEYAPYRYLAVEVAHIDIVADRAWGARAAGASWADLCWLEGLSPYEHIQSGYTKYFDWTTVAPLFAGPRHYTEAGLHDKKLILKPLNECTAEDLRMLLSYESGTFIHLSYKPDNIEDYRFTVIFTLSDGTVHSTPVTIYPDVD